MRLVTAHVPNTPGILAKVAKALADAELNITAFTADANRVRILTDTAAAAVRALADFGIVATEHHVLAISLEDRPGRLAEITGRLADAGINIEVAFGDGRAGTLYLRVADHARAQAALARLA